MTDEELKEAINNEMSALDFDKELLSRILNPMFRGEGVDEDKLVNDFLSRIEMCLEY